LNEWAENDVLLNLWSALLNQPSDQQKVKWDERFIDGMFVRAKWGSMFGKTKCGKGTMLMVLAHGAVTPLGIYVVMASPSDVKLAEATLDNIRVTVGKRKLGKPKRLVVD